MSDISKEQFLAVYNKYQPNKWTKFAFRYFSANTKSQDKWLNSIVEIVEGSLFLTGFVATIFNASKLFIKLVFFPFCLILVSLTILMLGAFIMNNLRIRKIRKTLGITQSEYNWLVDLYL